MRPNERRAKGTKRNTSADWKNDVQISHLKHVNSIINDALNNIKAQAREKNTATALQCQETARLELKSITQSAYNQITGCTYPSSSEGVAINCAQKVDSIVFEQSLIVSNTASDCIRNM
ncbi:PREDICTED: uncharacterized protein LOC105363715 [Ceratosolen solmsi marchali]|uniref:Uncharacterized protein LOC105363715 n=1 Tax=Ceratosolen solmsi marchali TaxID=326594 RepID=A0AAJ7DX89_9HYME|nr:PREDICTED: uncharacterized protein LOC105363715 [Ceratosolen solmsi marchali]